MLSRLINQARVLAGRAVEQPASPEAGRAGMLFRDGQPVRVFGEMPLQDGNGHFRFGYTLLDPNGRVDLRGPENGLLNRVANLAFRSPLETRVPVRMTRPDGRTVVENVLAVDLGVNRS